jgi:hypothetical protein
MWWQAILDDACHWNTSPPTVSLHYMFYINAEHAPMTTHLSIATHHFLATQGLMATCEHLTKTEIGLEQEALQTVDLS